MSDPFKAPEGMELATKIEVREGFVGGGPHGKVPMLLADLVDLKSGERMPLSCIPAVIFEIDTSGACYQEWLALLQKMIKWMIIESTGQAVAEFRIIPLNKDGTPQ